ncbi:sterol desaturase family protein [Mycolicibacter senuensis]|uniref:Fatty acid hydroxylase n=1 Tax=Mycolicibacter senuensis TaxID=386913 RepID=A0A7I9XJE1_9MYCO|nr:sterol desaturase family protein [Mycolicibacter senuensis]MDQ2626495.1 sterol desaturase family protein [Actinomycetota bacterium]ORW67352.1 fatty acid hydroxylase [Mycolicibacter senuensis]GFG69527.1 fatty acid hydroxylase [Mycolicibacter senuensis]
MTTPMRSGLSLADAGREFWRHPSPWCLALTFIAALTARIAVGDWQLTDAVLPALMIVAFPVFEWLIHVGILHWRPRSAGRLTLDPLLARKHREHHRDPRRIELIFIPRQTLLWLIPTAVTVPMLVSNRLGLGLTSVVVLTGLGVVYEWTHYLIHTDYKPKTSAYRSIWRNHRQHHFKNENYWFTITTTGTADRLLGTYPEQSTVPTSPTAKNLHGAAR